MLTTYFSHFDSIYFYQENVLKKIGLCSDGTSATSRSPWLWIHKVCESGRVCAAATTGDSLSHCSADWHIFEKEPRHVDWQFAFFVPSLTIDIIIVSTMWGAGDCYTVQFSSSAVLLSLFAYPCILICCYAKHGKLPHSPPRFDAACSHAQIPGRYRQSNKIL